MFDCVTGVTIEGSFGCILADEMGLGKSLQCVTLAWTLIKQSPQGGPTCSKASISLSPFNQSFAGLTGASMCQLVPSFMTQ